MVQSSSGFDLFVQAETAYSEGRHNETFDLYQRAIRKIIEDENVTAVPPTAALLPDSARSHPRETLGMAWMNFVGFFKDKSMHKTKGSLPSLFFI